MKIWLDMDGTLVDFYGVEGWLTYLENYDATPYKIAKPLVNLSILARFLNKIHEKGYEICIITALSKRPTADFDKKVIETKEKWLKKHLKSVKFDEIRYVPYTFCKNDVNCGDDMLIDDENRHLEKWTGTAIHASEIMATLKALAT